MNFLTVDYHQLKNWLLRAIATIQSEARITGPQILRLVGEIYSVEKPYIAEMRGHSFPYNEKISLHLKVTRTKRVRISGRNVEIIVHTCQNDQELVCNAA